MQMGLLLGSFSRALVPVGPFSAPLLAPFCFVAPSYIKQTVSLAALGNIAVIIQHCRMGVMQYASPDTLDEDLSLLK